MTARVKLLLPPRGPKYGLLNTLLASSSKRFLAHTVPSQTPSSLRTPA